MKEIVVLSGKGGTGKTSITAALASVAGDDVIIADCDVDAANMHILMQPRSSRESEFFGGSLASIDQSLCTSCGICADKCRFEAITFSDGKYEVNPLDCDGCGYCALVCPVQAITMHERKSGMLYISNTRLGHWFIHARLVPGAENSGKLVAAVKNEAKAIALAEESPFILVDGSPGIGCPVVSSLAGAHFVVLVAEPTLSGFHDLKRAFALVNKVKIKTGCIINKHDLNPVITGQIVDYLKESGIIHLANLPFDTYFTRAMVNGKTPAEEGSPFKSTFEKIWSDIESILTNKS